MIFYVSIALCIVTFFAMLTNPRKGILWLLFSMPIVSATWNVRFFGLSLISLMSMIPLLLLPRLKLPMGFSPVWMTSAKLILCASVLGLPFAILYSDTNAMFFLEYLSRSLNVMVGFFMIPLFINNRNDFYLLLKVFLLAGLFPVGVAMYQAITGVDWQGRMIMGVLRYDGFYHDSVSVRMFIFPTLFAIVVSLLRFSKKRPFYRLFLYGYLASSMVGLYNISSRAVFAILLIWTVGLTIFYRRWSTGVVAIVSILSINWFGDNFIFDRLEFLLQKETAIFAGEMDQKYLLSGRSMLWQDYWETFQEFGILATIFGAGWTIPAHNEFLRIIFMSGFVGLTLWILGVFLLCIESIKNWARSRELPQVCSVLLMASFLIDCIGIVPGLYPYYNWFLWGMLGILLYRGRELFLSEQYAGRLLKFERG